MTDANQFSFTEIAAGLTILGMLGSAFIWALSKVFVTKKAYYVVRDKDAEAVELQRQKTEAAIAEAKASADACNKQHELAKAPFQAVVDTLREVKDSINKGNEAAAKREEHLISVITNLDKRVTVIEQARPTRRRR